VGKPFHRSFAWELYAIMISMQFMYYARRSALAASHGREVSHQSMLALALHVIGGWHSHSPLSVIAAMKGIAGRSLS
jgi:hypothetical protein